MQSVYPSNPLNNLVHIFPCAPTDPNHNWTLSLGETVARPGQNKVLGPWQNNHWRFQQDHQVSTGFLFVLHFSNLFLLSSLYRRRLQLHPNQAFFLLINSRSLATSCTTIAEIYERERVGFWLFFLMNSVLNFLVSPRTKMVSSTLSMPRKKCLDRIELAKNKQIWTNHFPLATIIGDNILSSSSSYSFFQFLFSVYFLYYFLLTLLRPTFVCFVCFSIHSFNFILSFHFPHTPSRDSIRVPLSPRSLKRRRWLWWSCDCYCLCRENELTDTHSLSHSNTVYSNKHRPNDEVI